MFRVCVCSRERMLRRRAEIARAGASLAAQAQAFRAWRTVFLRKHRLVTATSTVQQRSKQHILAAAMQVWRRTRELKYIVRDVRALLRRHRLQWGLVALARYCAIQRAARAAVKLSALYCKRSALKHWVHRFQEARLVEEYAVSFACGVLYSASCLSTVCSQGTCRASGYRARDYATTQNSACHSCLARLR